MNIQAINNQTSFKALIIPKNQVFTPEQQTIVKEVETVANKRYPHDKNLRSYIDYLEKDAFCDLLLKSNKDNKSVEMYIKNQYAKEATYLETFSKERPVEEIAFLERNGFVEIVESSLWCLKSHKIYYTMEPANLSRDVLGFSIRKMFMLKWGLLSLKTKKIPTNTSS